MYSETLDPVADFMYLGHTDAYNNSDWVDLYQNLWKSRRHWEMVEKVVSNTGSMVWAWGILYKAVVQSVLLYGSESWVVQGAMIKVI